MTYTGNIKGFVGKLCKYPSKVQSSKLGNKSAYNLFSDSLAWEASQIVSLASNFDQPHTWKDYTSAGQRCSEDKAPGSPMKHGNQNSKAGGA